MVIKVDTVEERSDSALAVAGDAILDGETAVRFQLTLDRNLLVRTSRFEGKTIIETESSGVFEGVESSRNFANNGTVRFHNQFSDMNREMNVVPIEFKPILNRADFLKFADFSPPATAKVSVHDYSRIKKLESSESNSNGSLGLRFIALCVLFMILTCVLAFRKAYIQRKAS